MERRSFEAGDQRAQLVLVQHRAMKLFRLRRLGSLDDIDADKTFALRGAKALLKDRMDMMHRPSGEIFLDSLSIFPLQGARKAREVGVTGWTG